MKKRTLGILALGLAVCVLAVPSGAQAAVATDHFVIKFDGTSGNLASLVEAAGGEIVRSHDAIGYAVAASASAGFAANLSGAQGVEQVTRDYEMQWVPGEVGSMAEASFTAAAVTDPTTAFFYPFQWNMMQIDAAGAWAVELGDPNVTVAVLDTGIDYTHQDLVGKVDLARSVSFQPFDDFLISIFFPGAHPIADLRYHGTHVAGTIACNALGTACVAPNVTLMGVKVLNVNGSGTFSAIIAGIMHAADNGADIINMSLGVRGGIPKNLEGAGELVAAVNKAVNYANSKGVLVVSSAGNDGIDGDHNGNSILTPAENGATLAVSATGPTDELAGYSNYGSSVLGVAAPGGNFDGDVFASTVLAPCSTFSLVLPFTCGPTNYLFLQGTSMAAPHASGVAALIDSLAGGGYNAGQLKSKLQQSADDLGKKGNDPFYGKGRVNAANAVQ